MIPMQDAESVTLVVANEADLSIVVAPPSPEAITTSVAEFAKSIGAKWDEEAQVFYMAVPVSEAAPVVSRDAARSAARIMARAFQRVGLTTRAYFIGRA